MPTVDRDLRALVDVMASLAAAISLLSRSSKKAAPSDKMFDQMLKDYQASLDRARAYLTAAESALSASGAPGPVADAVRTLRVYADALRGSYASRYDTATELDRVADRLEAAHPQAPPLGWQLVPEQPTPEMLGAWYRYKNGHRWPGEEPARDTSDVGAYKAMLSAAPLPAQQEGE